MLARIQGAVSVAIAVSVTIGKNRFNAEIVFHIAAKTQFDQLKNLSNAAILSRISHILKPWMPTCRLYATQKPPTPRGTCLKSQQKSCDKCLTSLIAALGPRGGGRGWETSIWTLTVLSSCAYCIRQFPQTWSDFCLLSCLQDTSSFYWFLT